MSRQNNSPIIKALVSLLVLISGVFCALQIQNFLQFNASLKKDYVSYIQAIHDVQNAAFEYDMHFDNFSDGNGDWQAIRIALDGLKNAYGLVLKKREILLSSDELVEGQKNHNLRQIESALHAITEEVEAYNSEESSRSQIERSHGLMHGNIETIFRSLTAYQSETLGDYEHGEVVMKMHHKQSHIILFVWYLIGIASLFALLFSIKCCRAQKTFDAQQHELDLLQRCLSALDRARDAILITDEENKVVYANRALCAMNGLSFDDKNSFINKPWSDVLSVELVELAQDRVVPALRHQSYWIGEINVTLDSGQRIDAEISVTRLVDSGMVATFTDLSDKRRSESEKQQLEEQFYQAQKMEAIGRLAGGIAHDFNNILAAMNGYAEFLVDDLDEDSEQYQFANNILLAGLQARGLTDQLLSFSRRSDVEKEAIDLVLSIDETISMLKATLPKTIEIERHIEVPRAFIQGNSTQVSQLMMNLCLNGADAIEDEHGKLRITIDITNSSDVSARYNPDIDVPVNQGDDVPMITLKDHDGGRTTLSFGRLIAGAQYARISVEDTGSGMSRTIMEHIFEPFFTTKPVDKGTGLGLSMVHGVVLTHQAFMLIDSTLGHGTNFEIYLPLAEEEMTSNIVAPIGKDFRQQKVKKARHILLVEDQDNVRDMILKMLERLGYKTSFADDGLQGLDMIRENPDAYDLVITDQNMPGMTGIEMITQVHMDLPNIPFVVLSGYSEEKIQEMIKGHGGIKAVIKKPVSKDILSTNIRSVLGGL